MNYYYADGSNEVVGPVSEEQLRDLYTRGNINLDTNVIPEGSNDWQPYHTAIPVPHPPPVINLAPVPYRQLQAMPPPFQAISVTKTCPFCAEEISPAAKKCKHCGETLDVALRAAEEAKRSQSHQPMVFMNSAAAASTAIVSQKRGFPHLLHLVLTVCTGGLWFPIWILLYIFRNRNTYA